MRRVVEIEYLEQGTPVPAQRRNPALNIVGNVSSSAYDRD